jgi:pyruvate dehydrogenase kinase 2/3/4
MNRDTIPHAIAAGVMEWRTASSAHHDAASEVLMEEALYRFFTARVGLRFLAEHFVLSSQAESVKDLWNVISLLPHEEGNKMRGCIQPNVDIVAEVQKVVDLVKRQAGEYYQGLCPQIDVVDCVQHQYEFTHVPHHLQYMFYELLKNSCRASIRRYHAQQQTKLQSPLNQLIVEPEILPIRVIVSMGEEDVTIKVADRGGGIPRSAMATIWKFAHSTASHDELDTAFGREGSTGAKLRGFGLPLARIYARYFGGELTLKSTEGYGLDAYLHIPRLGTHCENLPLRVRDSPGERDSMPDWNTTTR